MNSRQQQLCVALGAVCLLAGCGPAGSGAQGQGETGAAAQPAVAAAIAKCPTRRLTVRMSDDDHLEPTQRVRFIGPNQDGDYRLRMMLNPPQPKPHWLDKDFNALEDDDTGTLFYASIEVKDDVHEEVEVHNYRITMELQGGCVTRARFHTEVHPSSDGTDHGGDAVMD